MSHRRWIVVALLFAGLSACRGQTPTVGSSTESPVSTPSVPASPSPGECKQASGEQIAFELRDFSFNPACAAGTGGMGLSIKNNGDNLHNFSVEGFAGIDVDIQPGGENNTEETGLPAGTYVLFCKYHRTTNNMQGTLQIK
jgi:plastocyanin